MNDVEKLQIQIEALEELNYKTFWTFENDEPRMKTVVVYSDVLKSINDRKSAIFISGVIHSLIKAFT